MKKFPAYLILLSLIIISLSACAPKDNTPAIKPPPPTASDVELRADAGDKQVTLYWPMVAGADTYNIYKGPTETFTKSTGTLIATGQLSAPYPVTGLTNGTTYYFAFTAVSTSNGESDLSEIIPATPQGAPDLIPPEFPKNVRANNAGSQTVIVTWTPVPHVDGVADIDHYNLYCTWLSGSLSIAIGGITVPGGQAANSQVVGLMNWIIGTDAGTTTGLTKGTLYSFSLTAETVEIGPSVVVSATPGTTPGTNGPVTDSGAVVTSISAATGTSGQVNISWVPLDSATANTSYNLYYYPTTVGTSVADKKIPGIISPWPVSGLEDGISYSFYLTSDTASGISFSALATPSATPPPAAPILANPTPGDTEVTLTWIPVHVDTVADATSYNIYVGTAKGVTKETGRQFLNVVSGVTLGGFTNDTKYYFVVTAVNSTTGESTESNEWWAIPSASTLSSGVTISGTISGSGGSGYSGSSYMSGISVNSSGGSMIIYAH